MTTHTRVTTQQRHGNAMSWRKVLTIISIAAVCATGCSIMDDQPKKSGTSETTPGKGSSHEVKVEHPQDAEARVGRLSSELLDMTQLRGEVTPGGPSPVTFDQKKGKGLYSVQHDWSVWKLSPEELAQGWDRLRDQLAKRGWRITRDGRANSKAQQPQIDAVHEEDHVSLSAELLLRSTRKDDGANGPNASKTDLILFSIVSPTYQAPKGVDPDDF